MKNLSRIWYAFAYALIWLKTFILWVLAFGTLAAIAFESIKGQIGLMIAVIFILIGLI